MAVKKVCGFCRKPVGRTVSVVTRDTNDQSRRVCRPCAQEKCNGRSSWKIKV